MRELAGDGGKFIKRKGFERLTLEVGTCAGLAEQVTAVGNFDKDYFGAGRHLRTTQTIVWQAISIRQKLLFRQFLHCLYTSIQCQSGPGSVHCSPYGRPVSIIAVFFFFLVQEIPERSAFDEP